MIQLNIFIDNVSPLASSHYRDSRLHRRPPLVPDSPGSKGADPLVWVRVTRSGELALTGSGSGSSDGSYWWPACVRLLKTPFIAFYPKHGVRAGDRRSLVYYGASHRLPLWGDLTRRTEEPPARFTLSVSCPSFQMAGPGHHPFQLGHVQVSRNQPSTRGPEASEDRLG
jgi:hypothetical protein